MRKFIALFLVFSLLALTGNLMAKKRGAELIVQKRDGQQVIGELIAVKQNSLLLLVLGADILIDIGDIKVITIVKKSRFLEGFLIGAGLSGIYWGAYHQVPLENTLLLSLGSGIGLGIYGAIFGLDETIRVPARPQYAQEMILGKLRKKARIPDYE